MPVNARLPNQSSITGPKSRPTKLVPKRWMENSASTISSDSGTTQKLSEGATSSSPSTAPSTEIAGVITLSP